MNRAFYSPGLSLREHLLAQNAEPLQGNRTISSIFKNHKQHRQKLVVASIGHVILNKMPVLEVLMPMAFH